MRWTKHALKNWLRMAGPSFDASLALEFLGFRLGDRKGVDAVRNENRRASTRPNPRLRPQADARAAHARSA